MYFVLRARLARQTVELSKIHVNHVSKHYDKGSKGPKADLLALNLDVCLCWVSFCMQSSFIWTNLSDICKEVSFLFQSILLALIHCYVLDIMYKLQTSSLVDF